MFTTLAVLILGVLQCNVCGVFYIFEFFTICGTKVLYLFDGLTQLLCKGAGWLAETGVTKSGALSGWEERSRNIFRGV